MSVVTVSSAAINSCRAAARISLSELVRLDPVPTVAWTDQTGQTRKWSSCGVPLNCLVAIENRTMAINTVVMTATSYTTRRDSPCPTST